VPLGLDGIDDPLDCQVGALDPIFWFHGFKYFDTKMEIPIYKSQIPNTL
jgi:hypothetical protein